MKTLALCLVLIALPLSGWAEDNPWTISEGKRWWEDEKGNCISGDCPKQEKSKRQEFIEKCDEYLNKIWTGDGESIGGLHKYSVNGTNAQIAQAYCTRALLEDK